ncbi:MAG: GNAT family N-acetyltransferase [Lachnospiraceae bacterium]|nr:GNAT family N-acetyltransferase [Lachnospiraceae bacterium]
MKKKAEMSLWVQREHKEARELWEEIFPEDSASFLDYYDVWKAPEAWIQLRHRSGCAVSMIQWNPYPVWMRGRVVRSFYLVAVATRPAYRHQGCMTGLLREGLAEMAERKVPFVFLMPADKDIYWPFDFRFIYDKTEGELSDLPFDAEAGDRLEIDRLEPEEYAEAAAFLQEQLMESRDVFTLRDAAYLERMQAECASEGGALEEIRAEGNRVGVFSWWPEEERIVIRELVADPVWEQGEKWAQLLGALQRRFVGHQVKVVTDGFLGEKKPAIMGRIVCLKEFLAAFAAEEETELLLQVRDPLLPENDGCFRWAAGPERSKLKRVKEETPDMALGVGDLISWLFGGEELESLPGCRMTAEGRRKAARIRTLAGTWFNEEV